MDGQTWPFHYAFIYWRCRHIHRERKMWPFHYAFIYWCCTHTHTHTHTHRTHKQEILQPKSSVVDVVLYAGLKPRKFCLLLPIFSSWSSWMLVHQLQSGLWIMTSVCSNLSQGDTCRRYLLAHGQISQLIRG